MTLKSRLGVIQGHRNGTTVKPGYGFIFAFHSNYGCYLHHFGNKARYWSKIAIFYTPLHSTPLLGGFCQNIAIQLGTEKLEWWAT